MAHLVVELLPDAFALPLLKVAVHSCVRRQVMWHHLPLATRALHIENAVEDFSEIYLYWVSEALGCG
jgi:hypothetical protein